MTLTLHSNGVATTFASYLRRFVSINNSLILEVDVKASIFMAKSYNEYGSIFKASSVSFAECGFTVDASSDISDKRIRMGFYNRLKNFIDILGQYSDKFDMVFEYERVDQKDGCEYACKKVTLNSDKLSMSLTGASLKIKLFRYISDELFYSKFYTMYSNTVSFPLDKSVINDIISTSKIYSIDTDKDVLIFYTKGNAVYVSDADLLDDGNKGYDDSNKNFEYRVFTLDAPLAFEFNMVIRRNQFIQVFDKNEDDFIANISKADISSDTNRILFDSKSSSTKAVISTTATK